MSQSDLPPEISCDKRSLLNFLCQSKKYSQREICRRLNRPRSYLRILEKMDPRKIAIGEIFDLIGVMGLDPAKIFPKFQLFISPQAKIEIQKNALDKPSNLRPLSDGAHFESLLEKEGVFLGALHLKPYAACKCDFIPPASKLLLIISMKGVLTVEIYTEEHVLKERELMLPRQHRPSSFYNSSQLNPLCALICSIQVWFFCLFWSDTSLAFLSF